MSRSLTEDQTGALGIFSLNRRAVDVSDSAGKNSGRKTYWQKLSKLGASTDLVVVDTFKGVSDNALALKQLNSAHAAGLATAAYIYLNFSKNGKYKTNGGAMAQDALRLIHDYPPSSLEFFAIDVEDTLPVKTSAPEALSIIAGAIRKRYPRVFL